MEETRLNDRFMETHTYTIQLESYLSIVGTKNVSPVSLRGSRIVNHRS